MPCRDERSIYDNNGNLREITELQSRLDEVTQNLCYLCGKAETTALHILKGNNRLADWWKEHKASDTKRVTEAMKTFIEEIFAGDVCLNANVIAEQFIADAEAVHPVSDFHKKWFHRLASQEVNSFLKRESENELAKIDIKNKLSPKEIEYIRKYGI